MILLLFALYACYTVYFCCYRYVMGMVLCLFDMRACDFVLFADGVDTVSAVDMFQLMSCLFCVV